MAYHPGARPMSREVQAAHESPCNTIYTIAIEPLDNAATGQVEPERAQPARWPRYQAVRWRSCKSCCMETRARLVLHETSAVLPDDTPFTTEIIEPERARELAET